MFVGRLRLHPLLINAWITSICFLFMCLSFKPVEEEEEEEEEEEVEEEKDDEEEEEEDPVGHRGLAGR